MKIKSEELDLAVQRLIASQAVAIHRSQQYMVPSHRRSSGCAVYNNANCSPERYTYQSPIREDHYQPRRNISPYENHRHVPQQHREREPVDEIAYENQPSQAPISNDHRNHIQHSYPTHQAPHPHPIHHHHNNHQHLSNQQAPQRFQNNQNHLTSYQHQPPAPPAYEEPAKNESTYENRNLVVKKEGRAEQPLAARVHAASSDRYAADHCPYDHPIPLDLKCANNYKWSSGKYYKDDCGSGIVATPCGSRDTRGFWCKTPLSIYQSSICELGRKLLCGEIRMTPRIMKAPPCNVCEDILPPCAGYYRNYEKLPSCEEQYVKMRKGKKVYRDKTKRYWEPCDIPFVGPDEDIRHYSGHNAYLAMKLNTKAAETHLDF